MKCLKYRFPKKQSDYRVQRTFHLLKNTFFKSNFSPVNRITSLMTYDYYDWASKYVHLFISYTAAL